MIRGIINAVGAVAWGSIAYAIYSGDQLSISKDALLITTTILLAIDCVFLAVKFIGENL